MQSGSIWKFRDNVLVKNFPTTPYINEVWNLWCGKIYHVCNYGEIEWTDNPNLFPHISEYGYGVLAQCYPDMAWMSVQKEYFGENPDIDYMIRCFNAKG